MTALARPVGIRKHPDVARALRVDYPEKSGEAVDELRAAGLLAGNGAANGAVRSSR